MRRKYQWNNRCAHLDGIMRRCDHYTNNLAFLLLAPKHGKETNSEYHWCQTFGPCLKYVSCYNQNRELVFSGIQNNNISAVIVIVRVDGF